MRRLGAIAALTAALVVAGPALATDTPAAPAGGTDAQASASPLPGQSAELIAYVTLALNTHNLDAIDRLVEWEGARPIRRRMTLYQIRYNFGRPIKSVAVEPFPAGGLRDAKAELNLKPNLPVTERLRVVFDEPTGPDGEAPTSVFLLGKENGVYRIALLLAAGLPK
jgi:hypothetical protein